MNNMSFENNYLLITIHLIPSYVKPKADLTVHDLALLEDTYYNQPLERDSDTALSKLRSVQSH